jgi:hypothetical protein
MRFDVEAARTYFCTEQANPLGGNFVHLTTDTKPQLVEITQAFIQTSSAH